MKKIIFYYTVVFLILFAAFPAHAQTGVDYYPLAVGNRWVYETSSTGVADPPPKRMIITVTGTDVKSGRECFTLLNGEPDGGHASYSWYEAGHNGSVSFIALGASNGLVLMDFEPPLVILPHNAGRRGAAWLRQYELMSEAAPDSMLAMTETCIVESVTDSVTVPAGTFVNCIGVKCVMPAFGGRPETVASYWYARNVGQVLSVRESTEGTVREELTEYKVYGR